MSPTRRLASVIAYLVNYEKKTKAVLFFSNAA